MGAALDLNPKKWLLFRTSYKHAERKPHDYELNEESFPLGEGPTALSELPELRKFDQAARGRDRADALIQIDAGEKWSFSASYGTTQDRYSQSLYGLLRDVNYDFSVDLTYRLHRDVSLFADYTREAYRSNQRSRQRTPLSPTAPVNDTPNNDWESFARDRIHTWGAGISASAFRRKVELDSFYSLSAAQGSIATRALGSPAIARFLVTKAQDYPNTYNRFHQLTGAVRVQLPRGAFSKFEYRYERYDRADFQIERMKPYMVPLDSTANTSIFLGADVPRYNAHILAVSLEYRF